MVPARGISSRILSLCLSACIFIAVALTLGNAVNFQFIGAKQLGFGVGFGDASVKPNTDHGHDHDSQAVDIDPSQQESRSQAAVVVDDPLTAGNGTRGKSSLPHTSGLRVEVDTGVDPSLLNSSSQAAVLDDPRAAYYPPGISTRGKSSLPEISGLRVVFVGDSLTRYMYLSLAAYLRQGRWIDEDKDVPNILEEKQFSGGWDSFYNCSKNYFRPYEQCDCFRPKFVRKTIENRYFVDPVRDNALYFFQK
jgi:hypothetical protein